jgi:hypothetical protein
MIVSKTLEWEYNLNFNNSIPTKKNSINLTIVAFRKQTYLYQHTHQVIKNYETI